LLLLRGKVVLRIRRQLPANAASIHSGPPRLRPKTRFAQRAPGVVLPPSMMISWEILASPQLALHAGRWQVSYIPA
jgi:hypothetical protein